MPDILYLYPITLAVIAYDILSSSAFAQKGIKEDGKNSYFISMLIVVFATVGIFHSAGAWPQILGTVLIWAGLRAACFYYCADLIKARFNMECGQSEYLTEQVVKKVQSLPRFSVRWTLFLVLNLAGVTLYYV